MASIPWLVVLAIFTYISVVKGRGTWSCWILGVLIGVIGATGILGDIARALLDVTEELAQRIANS